MGRWVLLVWGGLLLLGGCSKELPPVDYILVEKSKRRMSLYSKNKKVKTYRVALGANPKGHKLHEGDGRTPEGIYRIAYKNPKSRFHLSLNVSYPNDRDKARAEAMGKNPGGDIMIHGFRNGAKSTHLVHPHRDWTHGCIGVTNKEIREIYHATLRGAKIEIRP